MGLFKLEKTDKNKTPKNGKFINNSIPDEQYMNQGMGQMPPMDMPMPNQMYGDNPIANMGLNNGDMYNQMPMQGDMYNQMPMQGDMYNQMPMQGDMYNQGPIDDGMYIEYPRPNGGMDNNMGYNPSLEPQLPLDEEMPRIPEPEPEPLSVMAPSNLKMSDDMIMKEDRVGFEPLNHKKEEPLMKDVPKESISSGEMSLYEEPEEKKEETIKEEKVETLDETLDEKLPRQKEEEEQKGNPLENDKNPVPVNPVAPVEEKIVFDDEEETDLSVKANVFSAIGIIIGMILMPGTTIVENAKKFRSLSKALSITLWISLVSLVCCAIARLVLGFFHKSYNAITGAYSIYLDFTNVFNLDNYIEYLVITVFVAVVAVVVISLVYYGSSFLNSKGVHYATYLVVSNLSMIPFIATVAVLYPLFSLLSDYLGIAVLLFAFLYSLITLLMGMNAVLKFTTVNKEILYHVLNLSLSILIIVGIFLVIVHTGLIRLPEINI